MSDLISRSALERIVRQSGQDAGLHFADMQKFLRWLKNAPAIDAVSVVLCDECRYRCTQTCPMCHTEYYWDEDDGADVYDVDRTDDDGFCHLGARMDG